MDNVNKTIIQMIGNEICSNELNSTPDFSAYTDDFYRQLLNTASAHDVAHIVATALIKNGLESSNPLSDEYRSSIYYVMFRSENLNYVFEKACSVLEKYKIPYIPLKGAVIRKLYPQDWLRTGCDIDILVKEKDVEAASKAITDELGYEETCRSDHDISILSTEKIFIELHFSLMADAHNLKHIEMLENPWSYAEPVSADGFCYKFKNEMFYLYYIAHMAKHFFSGSCGLRPFIDLWLINKNLDFDKGQINKLLEKSELVDFERSVRHLSEVWFSGAEHDRITEIMQDFVFMGSSFGSPRTIMISRQSKRGGRFRYVFSRLFIPLEELKEQYPIVEKHPFLMPFFEIVRVFELLLGKKRAFRKRYINSIANESENFLDDIRFLFKSIGLN